MGQGSYRQEIFNFFSQRKALCRLWYSDRCTKNNSPLFMLFCKCVLKDKIRISLLDSFSARNYFILILSSLSPFITILLGAVSFIVTCVLKRKRLDTDVEKSLKRYILVPLFGLLVLTLLCTYTYIYHQLKKMSRHVSTTVSRHATKDGQQPQQRRGKVSH